MRKKKKRSLKGKMPLNHKYCQTDHHHHGCCEPVQTLEPGDPPLLQQPLQTSKSGIHQIIECFRSGTKQLKHILLKDVDTIFECKSCRSLFRGLPNLITHKKFYCSPSLRMDDNSTDVNDQQGQAISDLLEAMYPRVDNQDYIIRLEPIETNKNAVYQYVSKADSAVENTGRNATLAQSSLEMSEPSTEPSNSIPGPSNTDISPLPPLLSTANKAILAPETSVPSSKLVLKCKNNSDSGHQLICCLCKKEFHSRRSIRRHIRKVHKKKMDELKKFIEIKKRSNQSFGRGRNKNILVTLGKSCTVCFKSFATKANVRRHFDEVHRGLRRDTITPEIATRPGQPLSLEKSSAKKSLKIRKQKSSLKTEYNLTTCKCLLCKRKYTSQVMLKKHMLIVHKIINSTKNTKKEKKINNSRSTEAKFKTDSTASAESIPLIISPQNDVRVTNQLTERKNEEGIEKRNTSIERKNTLSAEKKNVPSSEKKSSTPVVKKSSTLAEGKSAPSTERNASVERENESCSERKSSPSTEKRKVLPAKKKRAASAKRKSVSSSERRSAPSVEKKNVLPAKRKSESSAERKCAPPAKRKVAPSAKKGSPSTKRKSVLSAKRKSAPLVERKKSSSAERKNASSAEKISAPSAERKNVSSVGRKNASSAEKISAPSAERKNVSSVGRKNASSAEKISALSAERKNVSSVGRKNALSAEKISAPSAERKNVSSVGRKNVSSAEKISALSAERKNVSSVGRKNALSAEKISAPSAERKNASSAGRKNSVSAGRKNALSAGRRNASSVGRKNTPSVGRKNAPSAEKNRTVSAERKNASSAARKSITSAKRKGTPSVERKNVSSAKKKCAASAERKRTASAEKKRATSAEKSVASAKKKSVASTKKKCAASAEKKCAASARKKSTASAEKKSAACAKKKRATPTKRNKINQKSENAKRNGQNLVGSPKKPRKPRLTPGFDFKKLYCKLCKRQFSSKQNLAKHIELHTDGNNIYVKFYRCPLCTYETRRKRDVIRHITVVHKKSPNYLGKITANLEVRAVKKSVDYVLNKVVKRGPHRDENKQNGLKQDIASNSPRKKYEGADVGIEVKVTKNFSLHTCDICGKAFAKKTLLECHKKTHKTNASYSTEENNKTKGRSTRSKVLI
ncbi:zinc finger protein 800 [Anolis sagrei]|uniref:zinc finger protein 800 n=1 Tax=Anolis sagrei TaxID=38937 RepID=UPI0035226B51